MASAADPEDVHPEYDRPTPENRDEWTDEQIEEWNRRNEKRLEAGLDEQLRELSDEQREKLELLESATREGEPGEFVETVELGDAEIDVTTKPGGEAELKAEELRQYEDTDRIAPAKDALIDLIMIVVVDDDYGKRLLWEQYYRKNGADDLMTAVETLTEPWLDRTEAIESFRGGRDRPTGT